MYLLVVCICTLTSQLEQKMHQVKFVEDSLYKKYGLFTQTITCKHLMVALHNFTRSTLEYFVLPHLENINKLIQRDPLIGCFQSILRIQTSLMTNISYWPNNSNRVISNIYLLRLNKNSNILSFILFSQSNYHIHFSAKMVIEIEQLHAKSMWY